MKSQHKSYKWHLNTPEKRKIHMKTFLTIMTRSCERYVECVPTRDLYKSYLTWVEEETNNAPIRPLRFQVILEMLGYERYRGSNNGEVKWRDLRLIRPEDKWEDIRHARAEQLCISCNGNLSDEEVNELVKQRRIESQTSNIESQTSSTHAQACQPDIYTEV